MSKQSLHIPNLIKESGSLPGKQIVSNQALFLVVISAEILNTESLTEVKSKFQTNKRVWTN